MRLTGDAVEYHAAGPVPAADLEPPHERRIAAADVGRRAGRVTQARVIRSEWTKLWSLRSTRWSLLAAVVAMAGLGMLVAAVQMSRWTHLEPQRARDLRLDRHRRRRLSPRPAGDRRARRAGDHRRVLDRA